MVKKTTSKTSSKKTTKAKATPVSTTTKTTTATKNSKVAKTTPVDENSLSFYFIDVLGQLSALRSQLTSITSQVRNLQKRAERELRQATKESRKRQRKNGNRAPSGFVKPTLISLELANFLEKPQGSQMARTQVTREINSYIREHSLQDPKNGRRILPDSKLRKLLKVGSKEELTYFNLQRYMSPHFAKAGVDFPAANKIM